MHLDGFRRMPYFCSCVKRGWRCWSCSWGERLKTRMLSIHVKQNSKSLRISSMKYWKVWAAFRRPKDIKGNSKRPNEVVMDVFWISSGCMGI